MVMMSRFHREERGSIPRKGTQQDGAEEACLAHNQEVVGSKPTSARCNFKVRWFSGRIIDFQLIDQGSIP